MELLKEINKIKTYNIEDILNKRIYVKIESIEDMKQLNKLAGEYSELFCLYDNGYITNLIELHSKIYIRVNYRKHEVREFQYGMTWFNDIEIKNSTDNKVVNIGDMLWSY
jgi:hypothetical protein